MALSKEVLQEIGSVVNDANQGNWIPFGIVSALLALVVFLVMQILKMREKALNAKIDKTSDTQEKFAESMITVNTIIAVHENEIQNLKEA